MAPFLRCEADPLHGLESPVVLLATIPGRDTGAGVMANMINNIDGYHLRGFAASAGFVHISEFTQRWIDMREKMTDPANPDYAYFSQFRQHARDGFSSSNPNSDFRSMEELMRRRIKPAWYHFYNMTNVLCGVRSLLIDAIHHPAPPPPSLLSSSGSSHLFPRSRPVVLSTVMWLIKPAGQSPQV